MEDIDAEFLLPILYCIPVIIPLITSLISWIQASKALETNKEINTVVKLNMSIFVLSLVLAISYIIINIYVKEPFKKGILMYCIFLTFFIWVLASISWGLSNKILKNVDNKNIYHARNASAVTCILVCLYFIISVVLISNMK